MKLKTPLKYRRDIEEAVVLLQNAGCKSVYLFGSMVSGKIHKNSDIDIGIEGLPPQKFIHTYSLLNNTLKNNIDLVDFDTNRNLFMLLNSLGEVKKIG
jgi:predicted nucleotidyltransferase